MKRLRLALRKIDWDLSKHLAHHLMGEDYTPKHRRVAGVFLAITGVMIAHGAVSVDILLVHIIGDAIGYGVHALGLMPILLEIEHKKSSSITTENHKEHEPESQSN